MTDRDPDDDPLAAIAREMWRLGGECNAVPIHPDRVEWVQRHAMTPWPEPCLFAETSDGYVRASDVPAMWKIRFRRAWFQAVLPRGERASFGGYFQTK